MPYVQAAIAAAQFAAQLFGGMSAAKRERQISRMVNGINNRFTTDVARPEFDYRYGVTRETNDNVYSTSRQVGADIDNEIRSAFEGMLDESRNSFDYQMANNTNLDVERFQRVSDVIGGYRQARITNEAGWRAAQAVQDAAQEDADALADVFMASRGRAAFDTAVDSAITTRNDVLASTLSGPQTALPTPPGANNSVIDAAFDQQQQRGIDEATGDATRSNALLARGDAFNEQELGLRHFSEGVDNLATDARISASPLGAQQRVQDLAAGLNEQNQNGRLGLAEDMVSRLNSARDRFSQTSIDAMNTASNNRLGSLSEFGDREIGSINEFGANRNAASTGFESARRRSADTQINSLSGQSGGGGGWDLLAAGLSMAGNVAGSFRGRRPTTPVPPKPTPAATGTYRRGSFGARFDPFMSADTFGGH